MCYCGKLGCTGVMDDWRYVVGQHNLKSLRIVVSLVYTITSVSKESFVHGVGNCWVSVVGLIPVEISH